MEVHAAGANKCGVQRAVSISRCEEDASLLCADTVECIEQPVECDTPLHQLSLLIRLDRFPVFALEDIHIRLRCGRSRREITANAFIERNIDVWVSSDRVD